MHNLLCIYSCSYCSSAFSNMQNACMHAYMYDFMCIAVATYNHNIVRVHVTILCGNHKLHAH